MKQNDKIFSMIILSLALLVYLFLSGYDRDQKALLQVAEAAASEVGGEGTLTDHAVESIFVTKDLVTIEGWALVRGTASRDVIPAIFLVDEEGQYFSVTTRVVKREDMTGKIGDGQNYTNSGFRSTFMPDSLERDSTYTLLIRMEIGETTYTALTDTKLELP